MDFMSLLVEYLQPEFIIVAVICFALGMFLKKLPNIPDWTIPFAVLGFGIILAIVYQGFVLEEGLTAKSVILGFMQGFLCAAAAVFVSQAKIQYGKRNEENVNYNNYIKVSENAIYGNINKQIRLPEKKPPEKEKKQNI